MNLDDFNDNDFEEEFDPKILTESERNSVIIDLLVQGEQVIKIANILQLTVQEAPLAVAEALDSIKIDDVMNMTKINLLRFKQLTDKMQQSVMSTGVLDVKMIDAYRKIIKDYNSEISGVLKVQNDMKKTMLEEQRKNIIQYLRGSFLRALEINNVEPSKRSLITATFVSLIEKASEKSKEKYVEN